MLDGLRVSKFTANFHFWTNYSFKNNILGKGNYLIIMCKWWQISEHLKFFNILP